MKQRNEISVQLTYYSRQLKLAKRDNAAVWWVSGDSTSTHTTTDTGQRVRRQVRALGVEPVFTTEADFIHCEERTKAEETAKQQTCNTT